MSDISQRRAALERERRIRIAQAIEEWETKVYYPEMKKLRAECEVSETGHSWRWTNNGPLGDPWFQCMICGATKVEHIEP